MCYYKGLKVTRQELLHLLQQERELKNYEFDKPMESGFDYSNTAIIVPKAECEWDVVEMEWGFIPQYWFTRNDVEKNRRGYTDETGKYHPQITTLNAIGEELLLPGKIYRDAALKRRCLFPFTNFYEWRHVFPMGKKGQPLKTAVKYPYNIGIRDEEVFLVAGIWQTWTDRDSGETVDTCALVTTKANSMMEKIHNSKKRMPCILTRELAGEWLSDGLSEKRITEIATYQIPAEKMQAHTIHKDFRTALNPGEKYEYAELLALEL